MSTPKGHTALWKNCTWGTGSEKLAFFNHYFKSSQMVTDRINNEVKRITGNVLELIQENKIKLEDNKTRPVTIQDIVEELRRL